MKTKTKNILGLLLIFILSVYMLSSCREGDHLPDGLCGPLTGKTIDKESGRVYSRTLFGSQVYYIGNPDTTLRNGGLVPCNDLLDTYIPDGDIGVLVIYSGELNSNIQSSSKDPYDPLYGGIELTFIEIVDEG